MNLAAKLRFGALILGLAPFAFANTLPPVWEPVGSTSITSWSDLNSGVGLATIEFPSNFVFPLFGENYTSAVVSSNGSIYFVDSQSNPPNSAQPQADPNQFLQGLPRIAPAWYDDNAINGSGSILVNMLSGQLVFTWENISSYAPPPGQSVAPSNLATFQVTLDSDGEVIFGYQALNSLNPSTTGVVNSLVGSQQAIVGITDGFGVAMDPGSTDLSALGTSTGFSLSTGNTVYQLVKANPPDNSNFAGLDLLFTPQTGIGWRVTSYYTNPNGQTIAPEPGTCLSFTAAALAFLALWWREAAAAKLRSESRRGRE